MSARRIESPLAAAEARAAPAARTAPAKINLALEILGRRGDGFHALRSVFAPLALEDRLSVVCLPPDESDRLTVRGVPAEELGPVEQNLVLRAVSALRCETDRPGPPLAFTLDKRIPVAAGLGGGSSDAASAMRLAAAAWGLPLGNRRFRRLAAGLGSDVPFFTLGGWALAGGRGERLSPLPPVPDVGVLLVTAGIHVPTGEAYAAWDAARAAHGARQQPRSRRAPSAAVALAARIRAGMTARELSAIVPENDLWDGVVTLVPDLAAFREELRALLGRPVHLSGSGPSLFALYGTPPEAERAARVVRRALDAGSLRAPGGAETDVAGTRTVGSPLPATVRRVSLERGTGQRPPEEREPA
jgi:4-diphosphocytidyl-2-C-methyl-D-erythritol kinase